jgi:adenylate cyclase
LRASQRNEYRRRHRLKIWLLVICGITLTALTLVLHRAGVLSRFELDSVDARFAIRGERSPPNDVVVVAVDDVTLGDLPVRYQDWPRTYYARVLRNLARAGTRAVIYDFQFTEPSRNLADDVALYEAAGAAQPVIFETTEVDERGGTGVFGSTAAESAAHLRDIHARVGHATLPGNSDGVIRRMSYSVHRLRSLGVVAAETVERRPIPAPSGVTGSEWIDYAGPPGTFDTISFSRAYHGQDLARLRGKIVVVGLGTASLQDVKATSAGGGYMSGPEIQANAFETARRNFPLRSVSETFDTLIIVMMGLIAPLLAMRISQLRALPVLGIVAALYAVVAQAAFQSGKVLLVAAPLLALATTAVGSLAVDYFAETRERRRLRQALSPFMPEAVVERLVERGEARLEGERLTSTVLFCDLRDFTKFAETMQVDDVFELLAEYLGMMSEAILEHGGTVVNYRGDGLMAVFGAPIAMDDHADRALAAAREMLAWRLPRFNAWIKEQAATGKFQILVDALERRGDDEDGGFEMGIGLNSGPVMSGNVGSKRRMEYAAVGDTTNTASRLEGMTKGTGHQLLVPELTRGMLKGNSAGLTQLRNEEIRGRVAHTMVWVPTLEWLATAPEPKEHAERRVVAPARIRPARMQLVRLRRK